MQLGNKSITILCDGPATERSSIKSKIIDLRFVFDRSIDVPIDIDIDGVEALAISEFFSWYGHCINSPVSKGKTLPQLLGIDDTLSLFWLTGFSQKKTCKSDVIKVFELVKLIEITLEQYSGRQVCFELQCSKAYVRDVIASVIESRGFGVSSHTGLRYKERLVGYAKNLLKPSFQILTFVATFVVSPLAKLKQRSFHIDKLSGARPIIAFTDDPWQFDHEGDGDSTVLDSIYWPKLSERLISKKQRLIWIYTGVEQVVAKNRRTKPSNLVTIKELVGLDCKEALSALVHYIGLSYKVLRFCYAKRSSPFAALNGIDYSPIITNGYINLVLTNLMKEIALHRTAKKALQKLQPIAILERKPFNIYGRVVLSAAHSSAIGAKSIGMQHGVVNNRQLGYTFSDKEFSEKAQLDFMRFCPIPSVIALWGRRTAQLMVRNNYPESRIQCIGNLRYDLWEGFLTAQSTDYSNGMTILLCLQFYQDAALTWARMLADASLYIDSKLKLIIKPHPSVLKYGSVALDAILSSPHNFDRVHIAKGGIEDSLIKADVVVVHSSTVGLDALVMNKKVIVIDEPRDGADNELFLESSIFFKCTNSEQIGSALLDIRDGKKVYCEQERQRFLEHHFSGFDQLASDRLLALIGES